MKRTTFNAYASALLRLALVFVVVYGLGNWWAVRSPYQMRFWMEWEHALPFVPWMILFYFSMYLVVVCPLLFLNVGEIQRLEKSLLWATGIAGVFFFLVPAPLAIARPENVPGWEYWFSSLYAVDNIGNTLPSLHITYSWMLLATATYKQPKFAWISVPWMVLIAASVVLVKQHYVADILSGLLLGTGILWWKYFPRKKSQ